MHTLVRVEAPESGAVATAASDAIVLETAAPVSATNSTPEGTIKTGDVLFQAGDARRHYRVEQGAIFHYVRWSDGSHELIEVAFPGEIVGLGHMDHHVSTAQAMVDSVVSLVSDAEIEQLMQTDDRLPLLLATAGEREFDYMRDVTLNRGKRAPLERVANYLMAVAELNASAGVNNGSVISDDITSGFVADRLQMTVDTLSSALIGLQHKGLVAPAADGGLEITNVAELERVANAA